MSGVYIPGMEMPKNCNNCPFVKWTKDGEATFCLITRRILRWWMNEVGEYCPLVPVPPHGRLIDGDRLYKQVAKFTGSPHWVAIEIKQAPTIIEAEEGE